MTEPLRQTSLPRADAAAGATHDSSIPVTSTSTDITGTANATATTASTKKRSSILHGGHKHAHAHAHTHPHPREGNTTTGDMDRLSPGLERGRVRSASPQMDDTDSHVVHGQEHGLRVEKQRRGTGFLLPSALRHTSDRKRTRVDGSNSVNTGLSTGSGSGATTGWSIKGKEKEREREREREKERDRAGANDSTSRSASHLTTPVRSNGASTMRSSPLAQVVVSPRPSYGDGSRSRPSTDMGSTPRSEAGSSQPRASSDYTLAADGDLFAQNHAAGIDPAQIVSMALNLSEGRRRHLSAGQLLQQQAGGARRAGSIAMPSPGVLQGSFQNAGMGGSLRQALSQHKRSSRNQSPSSAGKGTTGRHTSAAHSFLASDPTSMTYAGSDLFYRFTPSTLARAEKARQYIELSVEYRRFLDYLPPLKPDASAPGNYELQTFSVPGTPSVQLTRSPTSSGPQRYELGRYYNPLQMIRNRKLRMRNRINLHPDADQFADTDVVRDWIDEVQGTSTRPGYRSDDKVSLPLYPEDGSTGQTSVASPVSYGHQRNDSTIKPKVQRLDWCVTPPEHFADAYWMEMDSNKRLIENRLGSKIFPPLRDITPAQQRTSYESRRSQHSHVGSTATSGASMETPEPDNEDDKDSNKGHGQTPRAHRRDESRGRLKQVWHKARRKSRSLSSGLSSSDEGPVGPTRRRKMPRLTSAGHNIGQLEKHMNEMLDAHIQENSPDLISPGTPNKWGEGTVNTGLSQGDAQRNSMYSDSDHIPPESTARSHGRKGSQRLTPIAAHGRYAGRFDSRSSFEDLNSTGPNSPILSAHLPTIGMDLSPVGSRAASPPRRLGKPLLPFIRHDHNRHHRKGSTGDDGNQSSRQTSAEVTLNPRTSLEVPPTPDRMRLHRHKTSDSLHEVTSRRDSHERDRKEIKEPQSAMRRFFKGGRIGEIVRSEGAKVTGRGRKHDPSHETSGIDQFVHTDTDSMEESDTEETDLAAVRSRPNAPQRTNTGWSTKYNSDKLPSFRSARANENQQSSSHTGSDHISKQRYELLRNRSSKLDTLAPPSLDLSRVNSSTSNFADISRSDTRTSEFSREDRRNAQGYAVYNRNRSRVGTRLEAILDVPGSVGVGGLPVTGLSELSNEKPPARPRPKGNRQWSISDKPRSRSRDPQAPALNLADIARVRALLMCSGIKASSISRHAFEKRAPPEFLRKAAQTSGRALMPVVRREEHVLAAKMLTTHLETVTGALHDDADKFLSHTVGDLRKDLNELKDVVDSCIKTAQNLGDACVGFGSEVTGQRTLQVRQVVEQLEKLARTRRRRMRYVRRVGFGLVEWSVVLFMWWIWFIVVICKTIWTVLKAVGLTVKWVLWL